MKPIVLGMTCYSSHIETFLNWTLPSLLAPGNFPALSKERVIQINIHTDSAGYALLCQQIPYPPGVEFMFYMDASPREEKYLQLGQHQSADLRKAKNMGADYHCLMPDFVYSQDYFTGVLAAAERGHKAIARLVLSTTKEFICPELEKYRHDGVLLLPANHLATLGLIYIHQGVEHWLAERIDYPNTHVLVWEGENTLHLCSPHCTPVYIANEAICPVESNSPIDGILDKVIIGDIYCPKPEDGIVQIEITPKDKRPLQEKRVDLKEFTRIFQVDTYSSPRQFQIWDAETIDPIRREMLGSWGWWNDVHIATHKQVVNEALLKP